MRLPGLCLSFLCVLAGACSIDLAHDDAGTPAATGGAGGAGGAGAGGVTGTGGMVMGCSLLQASCPAGQACFPYPFACGNPTATACAYHGTGDVAITCKTQHESDGTSV